MDIEVTCPCCRRRLWKHGKYKRTVHYKSRSFVIQILRWRCPDCKETYSLIPNFIKPWARFANHIWEYLGRFLLQGIPKALLPELLTTSRTSVVSLKTIYRWSSQLSGRFLIWMKEQRAKLADDYPNGEGILSLYRHGINSNEECQFFLTQFFSGKLPVSGKVASAINIYLPLNRLW